MEGQNDMTSGICLKMITVKGVGNEKEEKVSQ